VESWPEVLRAQVLEGVADLTRRVALRRAVESYVSNKKKVLSKLAHLKDLALEVRRIKEESISRMHELAKEASDAIEENNGKAYLAKTADEARRIVAEIVGEEKLIVKSKSLTCEEILLREYLEEEFKCKVLETDLGEFIVQIRGEKPTHVINPSIHVPREEVAKTFSKLAGRELPSDIPALVAFAREYLRGYYMKADIGISGANVVAAQTGTIFIVENEGNARFSTNAPPVHVCVVGIEKVVPTLSDAFKVIEVLPAYATGVTMAAYVSMITSPSRTADIEKKVVYGAHGPKELHVVFLDNGRSEMAKHPVFREALYCLKCGGCLYECPCVSSAGREVRLQLLRRHRRRVDRLHEGVRQGPLRLPMHRLREVRGSLPSQGGRAEARGGAQGRARRHGLQAPQGRALPREHSLGWQPLGRAPRKARCSARSRSGGSSSARTKVLYLKEPITAISMPKRSWLTTRVKPRGQARRFGNAAYHQVGGAAICEGLATDSIYIATGSPSLGTPPFNSREVQVDELKVRRGEGVRRLEVQRVEGLRRQKV
jgi:L-lactate dehydrogenase complex protein LldG